MAGEEQVYAVSYFLAGGGEEPEQLVTNKYYTLAEYLI